MKKTFFTILPAVVLLGTSVAQASILLSADTFTILGGVAITSTGTSGTITSNGDIGLSDAAESNITGFPPGVIPDGSLIATGGVTNQAGLDLITVQNGLAAMPMDTNLSNVNLGGLTLTSGVYVFDVAALQTGDLILDGEGNPNAYWVFNIGTSLTTAINSTVTVINSGPTGGSDYGIFWNAGAEIVVGATNTIRGNYLSGTSITMGANSDGGGRALARAAVTLDQNEIDAFGGPDSSDWSGSLMYDEFGAIVPVPEPSTALLSGFAILGFLSMRRRSASQ